MPEPIWLCETMTDEKKTYFECLNIYTCKIYVHVRVIEWWELSIMKNDMCTVFLVIAKHNMEMEMDNIIPV